MKQIFRELFLIFSPKKESIRNLTDGFFLIPRFREAEGLTGIYLLIEYRQLTLILHADSETR